MAIDRRRWLPLPALGLIASAAAAQAPPLGPEVERIATGAEGTWGVNDAVQARMLELGGVIKPVNAKALAIPQPGGGVVFVASVTIPAFPYLRPAGDATYPSLAMRIQRAR